MFIFLLMFIYVYFTSIQVIDLFMEMQFEHLPFIKDLNNHSFSIKNFFSTYGEHITAGYNLILAVNFYLFKISGYFDNYLSIFINLVNFLIIYQHFKIHQPNHFKNKVFVIIIALISLSLTNNPKYGMALTAQLGMTLILLGIHFLQNYIKSNSLSQIILSGTFFIIANCFFLGGYASGVFAFFLLLSIYFYRQNNIKHSFYIILILILSLVIYLYIFSISNNNVLLNHSSGFKFDLNEFIKFSLKMIGNAYLGKSFFESTRLLWPYYFISIFSIAWSVVLIRKIVMQKEQLGIMIIFMFIYPIATIFFTSLFRHNIGGDPLGQWYFRHICFIPLVIYLCINMFDTNSVPKKALSINLKRLSMFLLFAFISIGNLFDIKKSPYVAEWKMNFFNQVPNILFNTDRIDRKDHFNSMLNEFNKVQEALYFFYSNDLWLFSKNNPIFFEKKLENSNVQLTVICSRKSSELILLNSQIHSFIYQGGYSSIDSNSYTFSKIHDNENYYEFVISMNNLSKFKTNLKCI